MRAALALLLLAGCAASAPQTRPPAPSAVESGIDLVGLAGEYRTAPLALGDLDPALVPPRLRSFQVRRIAEQVVRAAARLESLADLGPVEREAATSCGALASMAAAAERGAAFPPRELLAAGAACAGSLVALGAGPGRGRMLVARSDLLARRILEAFRSDRPLTYPALRQEAAGVSAG